MPRNRKSSSDALKTARDPRAPNIDSRRVYPAHAELVLGNSAALQRFRDGVRRAWRKWLDRRSQHARMNWERMAKLLERYPLPRPRIVAPYHPRAVKP
jgi:hypothetical protein